MAMLTFELERSHFLRISRLIAGVFPLTLQGIITLLIAAFALSIFGYGSMDLVVFSLAICALVILVFSLFCVVLSGIIIQRRIQRQMQQQLLESAVYAPPINLEAGYPNESGFMLPTLNYFPLVKLSWHIVYPDFLETRIRICTEASFSEAEDNCLLEEIIPRKRCKTAQIIRQFTVSDVLGFCRYSWRQAQTVECTALPKTNTVKPLPLLRSMTAEDGIPNPIGDPEGDRMEIRPYVPGDSVRNIMWKVFARNRQLNVRLAEKSVFHSKRTVAYLLSSKHDEAAAAVARVALESGALGDDWAFAADGSEQSCEDLTSALAAVAQSRAINTVHNYGLDNFLLRATGQSQAHCIVFAAAEMAPWLEKLKKTIGQFPGQFSLVLATDGFNDAPANKLWQSLLFQHDATKKDEQHGSSSRAELLNLLTELGQIVESTLVIDRKTGFSFDHNLKKV